jgi:hypothetical protein
LVSIRRVLMLLMLLLVVLVWCIRVRHHVHVTNTRTRTRIRPNPNPSPCPCLHPCIPIRAAVAGVGVVGHEGVRGGMVALFVCMRRLGVVITWMIFGIGMDIMVVWVWARVRVWLCGSAVGMLTPVAVADDLVCRRGCRGETRVVSGGLLLLVLLLTLPY